MPWPMWWWRRWSQWGWRRRTSNSTTTAAATPPSGLSSTVCRIGGWPSCLISEDIPSKIPVNAFGKVSVEGLWNVPIRRLNQRFPRCTEITKILTRAVFDEEYWVGYRQVEPLFYLFIFLIYRKVNEKFAEETLKALRGMEKVTLILCLQSDLWVKFVVNWCWFFSSS